MACDICPGDGSPHRRTGAHLRPQQTLEFARVATVAVFQACHEDKHSRQKRSVSKRLAERLTAEFESVD
jgi:hypothetical protein